MTGETSETVGFSGSSNSVVCCRSVFINISIVASRIVGGALLRRFVRLAVLWLSAEVLNCFLVPAVRFNLRQIPLLRNRSN